MTDLRRMWVERAGSSAIFDGVFPMWPWDICTAVSMPVGVFKQWLTVRRIREADQPKGVLIYDSRTDTVTKRNIQPLHPLQVCKEAMRI